jgi:Ca2+-binding RTX toxin-like protein
MATYEGTTGPDDNEAWFFSLGIASVFPHRVFGYSGDDRLRGGIRNDLIEGGNGNDTIFGELGNDRLFGNSGTDRLFGGDGDDGLFGGPGRDTLFGEGGDDEFFLNDSDAFDDIDGGAGKRYALLSRKQLGRHIRFFG